MGCEGNYNNKMKNFLFLVLGLLLFVSTPATASTTTTEVTYNTTEVSYLTSMQNYNYAASQIYPGMKYREYKKIYHVRDYESALHTRYSPFWSGAASFLITGLGQTCCGQFWRGVAFWCGKWALTGLCNATLGSDAALLAFYGVGIWSIADASRVAKIKSMYSYDIRRIHYRSELSVDVYPSLNCTPSSVYGRKTTPGMTLSVTF